MINNVFNPNTRRKLDLVAEELRSIIEVYEKLLREIDPGINIRVEIDNSTANEWAQSDEWTPSSEPDYWNGSNC